jgi:putative transposase
MAHTYVNCLMHVVFSTKERRNYICTELQEKLYSYIGGIAREYKSTLLAAGGIDNHIHLLLSIPSTISVSELIKNIKGSSSHWVHQSFPQYHSFSWQEGYSAFSVSISQVQNTIKYINSQQEHHKGKSFELELVAFLKKHQIPYDERYLWG